MDESQIRLFVDAMPWPRPDLKPVLKYGETDTGFFFILLHDPISKGWKDVAEVRCYTPERALFHALTEWCAKKGLDAYPEGTALWAAINRLAN